jgi:hypothetical protein
MGKTVQYYDGASAAREDGVSIARDDSGELAITVVPPVARRHAALATLLLFVALAVFAPLFARWYFPAAGVLPTWLLAAACTAMAHAALLDFDQEARRTSLRLDAHSLNADSIGPLGARHRTWRRDQIRDVRLAFSRERRQMGGTRNQTSVIIVGEGWLARRRCVRRLAGDEAARIADALRAGLGLPKRSWP